MDQISFYYLAFFLTIGSFLLGFVVSWNLKHVFDTWEEKADYAAEVIHPEMYDADGELASPDEILYLRFTDVSDTIRRLKRRRLTSFVRIKAMLWSLYSLLTLMNQ